LFPPRARYQYQQGKYSNATTTRLRYLSGL